jgi:hypothetical protein
VDGDGGSPPPDDGGDAATPDDGDTDTDQDVPADPSTGPPPEPDAAADLADYGTDAELDDLADACEEGDFGACDDLFAQSPIGSAYEDYGDSCGGRNEPAGFCTTIYAGGG